jgi:hypothetical protein
MMIASELLREIWDLVLEEDSPLSGYYHRRIPINCAFPAYAGIVRPEDTIALHAVSLRDETRGYIVEVEPAPADHADRSFIHITAKGPAFEELFAIVSVDVLQQWALHNQAQEAVSALCRRLLHWRRFFQRGIGGLSREEYIGLYAELNFLEILLDSGVEPDLMLEAWQGPLGTNQDFLFGSLAVEVKSTVSNDADRARVTNERQLDSTGLHNLFLFHFAFDFRENTGRTLKQLISSLAERLGIASQAALILLEERLLSAGYVTKVPSGYDIYGFTERKRVAFEIREDFPRIVESGLASGISDVSYFLDIGTCTKFRVPIDAIIRAMRTGV